MESGQSKRVGRYLIFEPIATGGMGAVHFGRQVTDGGFARTVVIKRLLRDQHEGVAALIDEAQVAARIRHPNVVPTLDVVVEGPQAFLVMEYVAGESLARVLRLCGKESIPLSIVAAILCDVLRGLHAAHEAESDLGEPLCVVHRDVSPQNVLVGIDGVTRVVDFGIAKSASRIAETTRPGQLKGKLSYVAPEQLQSGSADRRADIFAAGVVLWECITGRKLYGHETEGQVVTAILMDDVPPPSAHRTSLPEALDEVVFRALAKDPERRFATAHAFRRALESSVAPASPDVVSEWLQQIAGESLAQRAGRLAQIERATASTAAEKESAAPRPPALAPRPIDREAPTETATAADAVLPPRSSRGLWLPAVAVVALAAVAVVVLWGGRLTAPAAPVGDISAAPDLPETHAPTAASTPVARAPSMTLPSAAPSATASTPRPAAPHPHPAATSATAAPSAVRCRKVMGQDGLWRLEPPGCI